MKETRLSIHHYNNVIAIKEFRKALEAAKLSFSSNRWVEAYFMKCILNPIFPSWATRDCWVS